MRARNLKPSIFKNEILGTADPLLTILFEGLWCQADREGRLEDRPLRIKAEVFPYREGIDIHALLDWLESHDFICRYTANGKALIQVIKFLEHQHPHKNEVASVLPPMAEESQPLDEVRQPFTVALGLTPSSLTPDSLVLTPDSNTSAARAALTDPPELLDFKLAYPERAGGQPWRRAVKAINARLAEGSTWHEIIGGARRYAAYCDATGKVGTEFVLQAATFVGPDKHYLQPWGLPASKAQVKQDKNISAAQQWLAQQEDNDATH